MSNETKKTIREWTVKAPTWDQIVEHYRNRPGHIEWLAKRHPVMRGEIEDALEVTIARKSSIV